MIALILALELLIPASALRTPPLTLTQICTTRWGLDRRHVTVRMKREAAARDGLVLSQIKPHGKGPCCEMDHRIPRELGGADHVDNLRAQSWQEAVVKDHEENHLHRAVCAGTMTLHDAQRQMWTWMP